MHLHGAATVVTRHAVLCLVSAVTRWYTGARAVRVAWVVALALGLATWQDDARAVVVTIDVGASGICSKHNDVNHWPFAMYTCKM